MKVSVYDAKSKLSEMIKKAETGEEVIITRNGRMTVKLVRIRDNKDWVGIGKGHGEVLDSFFDPIDDDDTIKHLAGELG